MGEVKPTEEQKKSALQYLKDLSKFEYIKHQPQHKKDKDNG